MSDHVAPVTGSTSGIGADIARLSSRAPMRLPARAGDIADLVAALVANDYVRGEIFIADGRLTLTSPETDTEEA